MNKPAFSLAYTSIREQRIGPVVDSWLSTISGKHAIEVVMAVDGNNPGCLAAANAVAKDRANFKVVVQPEEPFNSTRGWNAAAAATTGKVILCIADDFKPIEDWDCKLFQLKDGAGKWMDEDWAVHLEDGYVHNIMVLSVMTRARYERFGYAFYPLYQSLFSDTEFTAVAYKEGRVIDAKHILIEHMHPDCNKRPRDHFDQVHASKSRWQMGEMLFKHRKNQGFPIDEGPRAGLVSTVDFPKDQSDVYAGYAAYLQATRDDLCLNEVCRRLYDEGIRHFFFCIPDEYWSGNATPNSDVQQVLDAAATLRELGAEALTKLFCVADYRFAGDSRIAVETRVRNDALAWVRQSGFNKICVVDSDELWPTGTLAIIKEIVDATDPAAISLPMIPVLGFPGYPVERATDRVTSYVGQSCVFRDCRTPVGTVYYENRVKVFHFTSTRRTMEETIEKHRQSGHFDDPEYDFDWWISHILPNVRPNFIPKWPDGRIGWHMYKKYQIWGQIREWHPDELADIPETIHQYLAHPVLLAHE